MIASQSEIKKSVASIPSESCEDESAPCVSSSFCELLASFALFKKFYLFLVVLSLCCFQGFFSSCGEQKLLSRVVRALLTVSASLVEVSGLSGSWASVVVAFVRSVGAALCSEAGAQ